MSDPRREATRRIDLLTSADDAAAADLMPLVYQRLRDVAAGLLRRERGDHTLQPTALVHEAWLDLIDQDCVRPESSDQARRRFIGLAASAMRRVLVDHARRRGREKRGGECERVVLPIDPSGREVDLATLLDLEDAIQDLAARSERAARIVEMRLYGGLTLKEIAAALETSLTTVTDEWSLSRALLSRALGGD